MGRENALKCGAYFLTKKNDLLKMCLSAKRKVLASKPLKDNELQRFLRVAG